MAAPRTRRQSTMPTFAAWGRDAPDVFYRAVIPARGLTRCGLANVTGTAILPVPDGEDLPRADILLVHRMDLALARDAAFAHQDAGGLLVVDDDDDLAGITCAELLSIRPQSFLERIGKYIPWRPDETASEWLDRSYQEFTRLAWDYKSLVALQLETAAMTVDETTEGRATQERLLTLVQILREEASYWTASDRARQSTPLAIYRQIFERADVVTVTTPELAERYRSFGRPVHVLPNCLDLQSPCYQSDRRRVPHDGVVVGWVGSRTHRDDLERSWVIPALRSILQEYDGRNGKPLVRLLLGGDNRVYRDVFRWGSFPGAEAFLHKLEAGGYEDDEKLHTGENFETVESDCGRYLFRTGTTDHEAVPGMFADVDIGVVPLDLDTVINRCKSDCKGLELAGMGVPCIASPIPAYQLWRSDPNTGAIVIDRNGYHEWLEALRLLIEDAKLRRKMGDQARTFAESRSIDLWAPKWIQVYDEALAQRSGKRYGARRRSSASQIQSLALTSASSIVSAAPPTS